MSVLARLADPAEAASSAAKPAQAGTSATSAVRPARVPLRCRPALAADHEGIVAILAWRFPDRGRGYWDRAIRRLATHAETQGAAQLGYVLQAGEAIVGVLLTISTRFGEGADAYTRTNLSSWCVEDAYRSYAALLVNAATRDRAATYVNISSERLTRPTIEAQGFSRYSEGLFFALPLLSRAGAGPIRLSDGSDAAPQGARACDRKMLHDHSGFGCLTFWCESEAGVAPLILARWRPKNLLPVAHVIYGPAPEAIAPVLRAVGPSLARRGLLVASLDASGPVPGLVGRHVPEAMARYAKGAHPPRQGDLAYTEWPLFGG